MDITNLKNYSDQKRYVAASFGMQALQQYMRFEEGDTVLDAGCGTGEMCSYISKQPGVASVVGFDLSPDFISYAQLHNSAKNVLYHVADTSDASTIKPEWQGAFSKVVCLFVLHWIRDKVSALKVLHSCLKVGGEILLVCPTDKTKVYRSQVLMASHPKWGPYAKDFVASILMPWPSRDLANQSHSSHLLEESGFDVIACHVGNYQYCFDSRDKLRDYLRLISPYLCSIPEDKRGIPSRP
ncbi:juvenile hormone acid O-methyltransferase-like [Branchiostoma lanceolatum]|uniref:juvenile hormone acid O-methyltransferase-like n=1 Tax=Branchiostoma lanceolatum TaxID=7740 RepID=UPI0034549F04